MTGAVIEEFVKLAEKFDEFASHFPGVPAEVLEELIAGHPDYEPEGFVYEGEYQSYSKMAESLVDAGVFGEIPEPIASHIDYESIGRDLDCGGVYEIRWNFVGYYWSIL